MPDALNHFTMERSTDGNTWAFLSNGNPIPGGGTVRSLVDGTQPNPKFYYRLKGYTDAGVLIPYGVATVTASAESTFIDLNSSPDAITITWQSTAQADSWEIWRSKTHDDNSPGEAYALLRTVTGSTRSTTDSGLPQHEMWFYKVRPVKNGTAGNFLTEAAVTDFWFAPDPSSSGLIRYDTLQLVMSDFPLDNFYSNATGVVCLALKKIGGTLFLADGLAGICDQFQTASFPELILLGADLKADSGSVKYFSAPKLPLIPGNCQFNGSNLTTINLNSLQRVNGPNFYFDGCANLIATQFPALTYVAATVLQFDGCNPLATLSLPVYSFRNGQQITADHDFLTAASVNGILARGVASNVSSCTFTLAAPGDNNAAPTGQGLVDKQTLISRGNTVLTH